MKTKTFAVLFALVLGSFSAACAGVTDAPDGEEIASSDSEAALVSRGGGPTGTSFACGAEDGFPDQCSCTGPIDSADCKAMEKNCTGPIQCGWLVDNCVCSTKRVAPKPRLRAGMVGGGVLSGN